MRIPFDSLCLAAVTAELQQLVGGRIQRVQAAGPHELAVEVYSGTARFLLLSASAEYARVHLTSRLAPRGSAAFGQEFRRHLEDSRVVSIEQVGLDRILRVECDGRAGRLTLIAELMGKHSNLVLIGEDGTLLAATKWLGKAKTKRPILPGQAYEPPPFEPRPSLLEATSIEEARLSDAASPFLMRLLESGTPLSAIQEALRRRLFAPVLSPGNGAYPLPLDALGLDGSPRESISAALEVAFDRRIEADQREAQRRSLQTQLRRVLLAREVALKEVRAVLDTASRAAELQLKGELILAYQGSIEPDSEWLECQDYEGAAVRISLRPDKTPVENATRNFEKAKRAKAGAAGLQEQEARLAADLTALMESLVRLETADTVAEINEVSSLANQRQWLHAASVERAEERPHLGHAVRETLSPSGWKVLYGENATANDYLTSRVAKPNDIWLHVRGAASAHVVIATANQPQRVQKSDLEFAAQLAARNSASKHSGLVSVDWTLKKYVRKPKGSAPGAAVYTHEKTLHVEPKGS